MGLAVPLGIPLIVMALLRVDKITVQVFSRPVVQRGSGGPSELRYTCSEHQSMELETPNA